MTKNMTRKGLALGAAFALTASAFVAAPANAAIEDFVVLAPSTGYASAYGQIAADGNTFSLTATPGATAIHTDREMKFLVTDPEAKFEPAGTQVGRALITLATADTFEINKAGTDDDTVTITDTSTNIAGLIAGDVISFDVAIATGADTVAAADTAYVVTDVTGKTFSFISAESDVTVENGSNVAAAVDAAGGAVVQVIREKRNDDNSFIIDSGDTNGGDVIAIIEASDAVARSFTIQAFTDYIENDRIDSLDYVSPIRTVTFTPVDEVVGSFSLTAPLEGATALAGTFTTTPLLNGLQVADTSLFAALFTRQGDGLTKAVVVRSDAQNMTTGKWPASVNTAGATTTPNWTSDTAVLSAPAAWSHAVPTDRAAGVIGLVSVTADKLATITTDAVHNLKTGDKITVTSTEIGVLAETSVAITVVTDSSFTYTVTETTAVTAASVADAANTAYTLAVTSQNVFAGDYSGQLAIDQTANDKFVKVGTASAFAVAVASAAETRISTAASSILQGASVITADTNTDAKVLAGTLSTTVTATIEGATGVALGAGKSVNYSFAVGANTTIKVNGFSSGDSLPALVTDANGQVSFAVTDTTGTDGKKVTITVTPEGIAAAASAFSLEWDAAAVGMYDLSTTGAAAIATSDRYVAPGASYDVSVFVADQFFNAAATDTYRVLVSGSGVSEGFYPLTAGKATVTVSDSQVATSFDTVLTLQKKNTAGTFASTTATATLTTKTSSKGKVTLAADASNLYIATAADLSNAVAAKALVERDTRTSATLRPVYTNAVTVTGKVASSVTGVSFGAAVVTLSGPSNILFSNGAVDARGGLTLVSDANGEFAVNLYSTSAQTDSVITVTSMGVSSTTKVSFVGAGIGEGTSLVVTMPAAVKPASTFQVKAKLSDVFGNGVATTGGAIKVTYTGAGIVFGTLPTDTDANGELMFSVLLGSNDTGSVNVTVSYDQNADSDYLDAKDLVTAGTTAITATGLVAGSSDTIVNVGTFSGKLVVYALNAAGSEVSYKIAGKWVTQVVTSDLLQRYDRVVGATGRSIKVDIYVDGVLKVAKSVVTK